jgi:hypothetical protein
MNERLQDTTPVGMLLDVHVSAPDVTTYRMSLENLKKKDTTHILF